MSERDGYRPSPNERRFTSEIFNPTDESHDSQVDGTVPDGEVDNESKPKRQVSTGIPLVDAAINGAVQGMERGQRGCPKSRTPTH